MRVQPVQGQGDLAEAGQPGEALQRAQREGSQAPRPPGSQDAEGGGAYHAAAGRCLQQPVQLQQGCQQGVTLLTHRTRSTPPATAGGGALIASEQSAAPVRIIMNFHIDERSKTS